MKADLTGIERASRIFIAVLLGILIWISAIDQEMFPVEYRLPVSVNIPEEYMILSTSADSATVRYTGSGWRMLSFQIGNRISGISREFVPLEGGKLPLVSNILLTSPSLEPEAQIELSQVLPEQISIRVDTVITRNLPVAPVFSDGIPARFRHVNVDPARVSVSGPASVVSLMDSIRTDSVFPGIEPHSASLALPAGMVAYSEDSVMVSVFVPEIPFGGRVFSPGAY